MSIRPRHLPSIVTLFGLLSLCGPFAPAANPPTSDPDQPQSPAGALAALRAGNVRFSTGTLQHPHLGAARMTGTTADGQHPFATVITCSDSRVPVEELFDQGIGDVFVIRVAGNVCQTDEVASIEYGIEHLQTPVLVVLGHTHCGAVTAVATDAQVHGNLEKLLAPIKPAVAAAQTANPDLRGAALVPAAVKANVWQSIDDLFRASPAARERVAQGKLQVVGALYHIESGTVDWFGEHPQQARLLKYTGDAPLSRAHMSPEKPVVPAPPAPKADAPGCEVLAYLQAGNQRYVAGVMAHPHIAADRRHETAANGQHPIATVIACSDSRVPVESIFDAGIGDLFVIRVAGNVCDGDEIGSIEYGVAHLNTPLLVILGHTGCGAVTAIAKQDHVSGHLPELLDNIKPAVAKARKAHPKLSGTELVNASVRENVWQSIDDLLTGSPETRELVHSGKLTVVGGVYDLDTGEIEWLGQHPCQRELLEKSANKNHAK